MYKLIKKPLIKIEKNVNENKSFCFICSRSSNRRNMLPHHEKMMPQF